MEKKFPKFLVMGVTAAFLLFTQLVQAAHIIEIASDEAGVLFALDNEGYVWGARDVSNTSKFVKLPNLKNIKTIAPYIAIDVDGYVYTWAIDHDEVETIEGILLEVGFTTPRKIKGISNATKVAHVTGGSFFAVINDTKIVKWLDILNDFQREGETVEEVIETLYSRQGVKAIAATSDWLARPGRDNPVRFGLIALYEDGEVMGWGISKTGQISSTPTNETVHLTSSPGASAVAISPFHVAVINKGIPKFWGGCDLHGGRLTGGSLPWEWGRLVGTAGYLTDVESVALAIDGDNSSLSAYLKLDGSVWLAFSPIPNDAPPHECGRYGRVKYAQPVLAQYPLTHRVLQVLVSERFSYLLNANHEVWRAGEGLNSWSDVYYPFKLRFIRLSRG